MKKIRSAMKYIALTSTVLFLLTTIACGYVLYFYEDVMSNLDVQSQMSIKISKAADIKPSILEHINNKSAAMESYNAYQAAFDGGSIIGAIIVGTIRGREMMDPDCITKNSGDNGDLDVCYDRLSNFQKEELGGYLIKAIKNAGAAELESIYHKKDILFKITVFASLTPGQLATFEQVHDDSNQYFFSANRFTHYIHVYMESLLH